MSNVTVGLVEDDTDQANLYSTWITAAGFEARLFKNGNEFRRRHGAESVDLLVLDWMLPDASGIELLEFVRHGAQAQLPVVMLTARGAEADIVTGLKAGADDYVIKPPRQAEFMARVQALLRRTGVAAADPVIRDVSPYEIDTQRRRITVAAEAIKLTDREFDLAAFVFRRPGRIVSRETLLAQVWNLSSAVTTRTVDTHMSRLRKKLKLSGEYGWQLTAVYQHGYRLEQK